MPFDDRGAERRRRHAVDRDRPRPLRTHRAADAAVVLDGGRDVVRERPGFGRDDVVPDDARTRRRVRGVDEAGAEREAAHHADHARDHADERRTHGNRSRAASGLDREPGADQQGGWEPGAERPLADRLGRRPRRRCRGRPATARSRSPSRARRARARARRGRVPPSRRACRRRDRRGVRARSGTATTGRGR